MTIPLFRVFLSPDVLGAINTTLQSGTITQGPKVDEFETKLKAWFEYDQILTVNSGTSALQLALTLANVKAGDTVISTPQTCSATNTAILERQANIVWADIDPNTGNITAQTLDDALTYALKDWCTTPNPALAYTNNTRSLIKAVMMVDWGGLPCDLQGINEVAHHHGLKTIEDAAHAFGAEYWGLKTGRFCDFTAFSNQAIKHLTTVDGGLLMTADNAALERGRLLRWFGLDRTGPKTSFRCELDLVEAGFKYHLNDVNASIGIANLEHIDWILKQHRDNGQLYRAALKDTPGIRLMTETTEAKTAQWLFTIRLPNKELRDKFEAYMGDHGIQTSQVHAPNHRHTFTKAFGPKRLPGVEEFSATQTNIPVGWWLTPEDREHVVESIHTFAKSNL